MQKRFLWGINVNGKAKINWVEWKKITTPKNLGGLSIGTLKDANIYLVVKWWWRLKIEEQALWVKVVKSIHDVTGRDSFSMANQRRNGAWLNICKVGISLSSQNINLDELFTRKIGNGLSTLFWEDRWLGNVTLKMVFPVLYNLENDKQCTIAARLSFNEAGELWANWSWNDNWYNSIVVAQIAELEELVKHVTIAEFEDNWSWEGDVSGHFTVKSMRQIIINMADYSNATKSFGNKWLLPKVNCFVRRLLLKRNPSSLNLCLRGIQLPSAACPMCENDLEIETHIFYSCPVVMEVWK